MKPRTLEEAFDPHRNSLTFMRLVLAAMVIYSHSFSLGRFGGGDWLYRFAGLDNFGTLAVAAFFTISGFLVTRSYCESGSLLRYAVHRVMRIFPGYWLCLAVTAFLFSPILYLAKNGSLDGFWAPGPMNPLRYVLINSWLSIQQGDVASVGADLVGAGWNISIWTLAHEFRCYILVGLLGWAGMLLWHRAGALFALILLVVFRLLAIVQPDSGVILHSFLASFWPVRLGLNFMIGVVLYLYRDRIFVERRMAILAILAAVLVSRSQLWWLVSPFALAYVVFYLGLSPRFAIWDKWGDYSYGVYLYGSVVQQTLVFFGLHSYGVYPLIALALLGVAPLAFLSYHLVERPAMKLGRKLVSWAAAFRPAAAPQPRPGDSWSTTTVRSSQV
jgi:peptidoglycan/LPS O-acetylase OafA/YrhL